MKQYLDLLRDVLKNGQGKDDRTGTGTISVFGRQTRYDLNQGFPLVTTKKVHLKSIIYELLWFLKGDTNVKYLNDNGVTIWDEWADANGDLGPIYGKQWTAWDAPDGTKINQIAEAVEMIKHNPDFPPHYRQRLERRRSASAHRGQKNRAAALPYDFSILCFS